MQDMMAVLRDHGLRSGGNGSRAVHNIEGGLLGQNMYAHSCAAAKAYTLAVSSRPSSPSPPLALAAACTLAGSTCDRANQLPRLLWSCPRQPTLLALNPPCRPHSRSG